MKNGERASEGRPQAEQQFRDSSQHLAWLENAEAWLSQEAERADPDAIVYLRSRGHNCKEQIKALTQQWTAQEEECLYWHGNVHPTAPPVTPANLEDLPEEWWNFWDQTEDDPFTDGLMLRTAEWCEITGFEFWFQRLGPHRLAFLTNRGYAESPQWLFNMVRSERAVVSIPTLGKHLRALIRQYKPEGPAEIALTTAIIFAHYRLKLENSTVVLRMIDRLRGEQDDESGAWPSWNRVASIELTAMAVHALAESKPPGWRPAAMRGRAWLLSEQASDGAWREEYSDPAYLTVLVLDAIALADETGVTTFGGTRYPEASSSTAQSTAAALSTSTRRQPGPRSDVDACKVREIVGPYGNDWRYGEKLIAVCAALDSGGVAISDAWDLKPPTWKRAVKKYRERVVKAIDYRLKQAAKQAN